ncbi:MAG: hypothetical protein K5771_07925 [Oscillospiraceae bacterium]|nr:hypothetical protein [Oscillospiraceae bacterium]
MPFLPEINIESQTRLMTSEFGGYDHNLKIADGDFYDTLNLTSEFSPLLADRRKRGTVRSFANAQGLLAKEQLAWVDGGTLYYGGAATPVTGLSAGEKKLISMGAYICIFPDKMYYNTMDAADYGSMEAKYISSLSGQTVRYQACRSDGEPIGLRTVSSTQPEQPANGQIWVNVSDGGWYEYSSFQEEWIVIDTVYTKISFQSIGTVPGKFREYDGVTISGAYFDDLNGDKILYAVGGGEQEADFVVVIGPIEEDYTDTNGSVTIERSVPQLDFVCECGNRLWGCFYGNDGEKNINEVCCCALGDFRNWRQYMGAATDSWTASVGSDGPWTGAAAYLGSPVFFKENCLHRVVISAEGAHQLIETECRGVQKGSEKSLCLVGETLFYKGRTDVCAWQGGFPAVVSRALGAVRYSSASAGAIGSRYYICMTDEEGARNLFVYDTANAVWMKEDGLNCICFAGLGSELYALTETGGVRYLTALLGTAGVLEEAVLWMAETSVLYYELPDKKYVSRYNIRLRFTGTAALEIEYDSSGVWLPAGSFTMDRTDSIVIPVRPRRCDHLRFRLSGIGEVRIFSITRVIQRGSDY